MADRCSKIALSRADQVRSAFLIPFFGKFSKKKRFLYFLLVEVVVSFWASPIVAFYMNLTARERPIPGADKTSQTLCDFHFSNYVLLMILHRYIMSTSCRHKLFHPQLWPKCNGFSYKHCPFPTCLALSSAGMVPRDENC